VAWYLDGYRPVQFFVPGFPDATEATDADSFNQLEPPKFREWRRNPRGFALIN
jgi:hypothetical protein